MNTQVMKVEYNNSEKRSYYDLRLVGYAPESIMGKNTLDGVMYVAVIDTDDTTEAMEIFDTKLEEYKEVMQQIREKHSR